MSGVKLAIGVILGVISIILAFISFVVFLLIHLEQGPSASDSRKFYIYMLLVPGSLMGLSIYLCYSYFTEPSIETKHE